MEYIDEDCKVYHSKYASRNKEIFCEADELIAPVIAVLNRKGYTTSYSCSSHISEYGRNAYIAFEPWVVLPSIPEGWIYEDTGNIIRYYPPDDMFPYKEIEYYYVYYDFILFVMEELYKWADGLDKMYLDEEDKKIKKFFDNIPNDDTFDKYFISCVYNRFGNGVALKIQHDMADNRWNAIKEQIYWVFSKFAFDDYNWLLDVYQTTLYLLAKKIVYEEIKDEDGILKFLNRLKYV